MNASQDNDDDGLFSFETEHVALRGNKDVLEVEKTLVILCALRERAIKDYKKVAELKKEALADPIKFLEKIIKGEDLDIPPRLQAPQIPVIDWSKYSVRPSDETLREIYGDSSERKKERPVFSPKKETRQPSRKWSAEEQKRLEELLQVYPQEEVEMRRFKKIAAALGNRTLAQVTSRVQKYFLKLSKSGLPIPGRAPKAAEKHKRSVHRHQRLNQYLRKKTTFFPDEMVPVHMDDSENVPGPRCQSEDIQYYDQQQASTSGVSSNYLLPNPGYWQQSTQESTSGSSRHQSKSRRPERERRMDILRRIKAEKLAMASEPSRAPYRHIGFKCNNCSQSPILGNRWHCITCPHDPTDFCSDCMVFQMEGDHAAHSDHRFVLYEADDKREELSDESESDESSTSTSEMDDTNSTTNKNSKPGSSDSPASFRDDEANSPCNTEMSFNDTDNNSSFRYTPVMINGPMGGGDDSPHVVMDEAGASGFPQSHGGIVGSSAETRPSELYYNPSSDFLESNLFEDIGNVSYDYLHSNMFLDKD